MIDVLRRWAMKSARPVQSWLPQSGFVGGAIFAGVIIAVLSMAIRTFS